MKIIATTTLLLASFFAFSQQKSKPQVIPFSIKNRIVTVYTTADSTNFRITSTETFAKLPKKKQQELLQAYFDKEKGIGYTLARTNINSCDFSSGSYTYVTEGDT